MQEENKEERLMKDLALKKVEELKTIIEKHNQEKTANDQKLIKRIREVEDMVKGGSSKVEEKLRQQLKDEKDKFETLKKESNILKKEKIC